MRCADHHASGDHHDGRPHDGRAEYRCHDEEPLSQDQEGYHSHGRDGAPGCHSEPLADSQVGVSERLVNFLGSASVFGSVLSTVVQDALAQAWVGNRLTLGQLRFLTLIGGGAEMNMGEIAHCFDVSNAAASRSVDGLVRGGLIERRQARRDRRMVRMRLTAEGEEVLHRYREEIGRRVEEGLRSLPDDMFDVAVDTLDRGSRALLDRRPEGPLPCQGCMACNLFQRDDCPLGHGRPHSACHSHRDPLRGEGGWAVDALLSDDADSGVETERLDHMLDRETADESGARTLASECMRPDTWGPSHSAPLARPDRAGSTAEKAKAVPFNPHVDEEPT